MYRLISLIGEANLRAPVWKDSVLRNTKHLLGLFQYENCADVLSARSYMTRATRKTNLECLGEEETLLFKIDIARQGASRLQGKKVLSKLMVPEYRLINICRAISAAKSVGRKR